MVKIEPFLLQPITHCLTGRGSLFLEDSALRLGLPQLSLRDKLFQLTFQIFVKLRVCPLFQLLLVLKRLTRQIFLLYESGHE